MIAFFAGLTVTFGVFSFLAAIVLPFSITSPQTAQTLSPVLPFAKYVADFAPTVFVVAWSHSVGSVSVGCISSVGLVVGSVVSVGAVDSVTSVGSVVCV